MNHHPTRLERVLFCAILFANIAFATQFRFGIQNISITSTQDFLEDDLILAIGANSDSTKTNGTWKLGKYENDQSISWSNLTQEIEVAGSTSNLSVAFGILNYEHSSDTDNEKAVLQLAEDVVNVATSLARRGPLGSLADAVVDLISDLTNCTGVVADGHALYTPDTLNGLKKNQQICNTSAYVLDGPPQCKPFQSNYSVAYCLERLDDGGKGGTGNEGSYMKPSFILSVVGLAVAMFIVG